MKMKGSTLLVIAVIAAAAWYFFIHKQSETLFGLTTPGGSIKLDIGGPTLSQSLGSAPQKIVSSSAPKKKKGFFKKIGAALKGSGILKKAVSVISPRIGAIL